MYRKGGLQMKVALIAAGLALGLAACETGEIERDADTGMAVDTVVTQRTVQDTAVVTTDTSVTVDTSLSRGDGAVARDTLTDTRSNTTGSRMMAPDTGTPMQQTTRDTMQQTTP
jgi:hypothetical protein